MNVQQQIKEYIASQPESKRFDIQALHNVIQQAMPACKLWFLNWFERKQGRNFCLYSWHRG